jgi:carboxyl-terminal processing protease
LLFKQAAVDRYELYKTSVNGEAAAGTEADVQFDAAFDEFIELSDQAESIIQSNIDEGMLELESKGSVQSLIEFRGRGTALKLTTAKYYTPSGRSIHRDTWNKSTRDLEREFADGTLDDPAALDDDPHAAPADSAKRPTFRTRSGRLVHGGGGITPDEVVKADTLAALSREIERRGLFFKLAVRYAAAHPGAIAPASVPPAMWSGFVALLDETKTPYTAGQLAAERPYLERGIRRELARRTGGARGDEAAFRVALEADVQLARAIELLGAARTPGELVRR